MATRGRGLDGAAGTLAGGRFARRRRLGAGASGVVFEAFDRERETVVAVKVLSRLDATLLLRFKAEFRTLADLSHPNLMSIYELVEHDGEWLLVMELVDGCDLRAYVRPDAVVATVETEDLEGETATRAPGLPADLKRLRAAMRQVAAGLAALHASGTLHLDLKPSNVLVDRNGRVVICDFGLSAPVGRSGPPGAGTVAYAAPEQVSGEDTTPASDWYSVGVMLYEALAGRLPHEGTGPEILAAKYLAPVTPPSRLRAGIPDDLEALCLALLRAAPASRPSGDEVLRRLGVEVEPMQDASDLLLGRDRELAVLGACVDRARAGGSVVVHVTGDSGVGKSSLVQRFLGSVEDAYVLSGRCYERESVPYKLLDGVIDELCLTLMRLTPARLREVLPDRAGDLSRLFPVVRKLELAVHARPPTDAVRDPKEAQLRGSLAWRELIGRMAAQQLVVIAIDDAQWGDLDSIALLADLVQLAGARLLLVLGYRDTDASTAVTALRGLGAPASTTRIALAPLASEIAEQLARAVMGSAAGNAARIAEEARGNPFLVVELARYASSDAPAGNVKLHEAVARRAAELPAPARRLLQVLAVAARPLELSLAIDAAGSDSRDPRLWSTLRVARFVRLSGVRQSDRVECYHDAIRETIAGDLQPDLRRELHLRLAHALEVTAHSDSEELAEHYVGAGERERAARHYVAAAEQAMTALAFDRSARLYRIAISLGAPDERRLLERLGEALASGGRGREAAEAFLAAADRSDPIEALELRRRASEHFLLSGHLDAGLETVTSVLSSLGLGLAPTPRRALASLAMRRIAVRVRGVRFTERPESDIARDELAHIDACWSLAVGLGAIDNIRGADFQARHLLAALRAGEPYRVARALCLETAFTASAGGRSATRTRALAQQARTLAERIGVPHAIGLARGTSALASFFCGEWRAAVDEYVDAERIFREQCAGVAWELANVHMFSLASLMYLGELRELATRTPLLLHEAEQRGDLYAATNLRCSRSNVAWLVTGDPARARDELDRAERSWPVRHGFHVQHFYQFLARTQLDLYGGDGRAAWQRTRDVKRDLQRSLLLRMQTFRIEAASLEGRAALAAWTADRDPALLATAERCARLLDREQMAWARPLASIVRASVLAARSQLEAARDELLEAARAAGACGMRMHAAAAITCARTLDATLPPDPWLSEQGVVEPGPFCTMLAPGPWQLA